MNNLSGQNIKGYELHERIGAGGFGAVYRAYQSTVGREVAIKVILPGRANQPDFIRRFEGEAQLIARLEHHHIVPLYDYWRDPQGAYLVMRWLRGGSLLDLLQSQSALTIEEAVTMMDQITQALHTAHRSHVIHRDIKPGNILLDEDGNAFLADFGIAKDQSVPISATGTDAIVGSPDYLSPEQARSEPVTPQTDVYSLGVVLFEMLEGQHPFPGLTPIERLYKHLNEPLPPLTKLDDGIRDDINAVIQQATSKDPMARFKDALALAQALRDVAALESGQATTSVVELLTPREQEVLQLIIDGYSNREIANELVLTVPTIKTYVNRIYKKLNVRSRVQAIVKARELDLIVKGVHSAISTSISLLPEPENPYKGLRAFQTADEHDFFGREKLTAKLLRRLQEDIDNKRFLAIVGPSGSGKSSVVKAGLIPALWRGEIQGSDKWFIVDMLPGNHPLDELEVALLRISGDHSLNLREQLERDSRGLLRVANLILPEDDSELLLVIDQFEEVFTLVESEEERQHFLDLLKTAVVDPRSRVRVILTLRADYYDRPLHYAEIGELMRTRVETVLPLGAGELEQAIKQPASNVGIRFADGLISRIISDVNYQPGALPLLQYALTELFERRDDRIITPAAYEEIGGTGGALAKRADEIFLEYDEPSREVIRQLFLRLVTLGEGTEDTRRRVERSELLSIAGKNRSDVMDEIIDVYAASRLLSLDHDPASRRPTVEVAHEAILREWERLRQWLNDSREDIRQARAIAQTANEWQNNNRDTSYLLRGSRLEQVEAWLYITQLDLAAQERAFIDASLADRVARRKEDEERTAREAAQEKREIQLVRQSLVRTRALVVVFVLAAILSGGFGLYALNQRNEAQHSADENHRRALAFASSDALSQGQYDLAVALAVESARDDVMLPESMRVLDRVAYSLGQRHNFEYAAPCPIRLSPDGQFVGFAVNNCSELILWDITTYDEIKQLTYPDGAFRGFEMSRDNQRLVARVTAPTGEFIATWDITSGEILGTMQASADAVPHFNFSSDSSTLALLERTQTEIEVAQEGMGHIIVLRDAVTFEMLQRYTFEDEFIQSFEFSADGSLGITGGIAHVDPGANARVLIFDTDTGEVLQTFERENTLHLGAGKVGISPDNNTIWLSLSGSARSYIIDRVTGEDLYVLDGWINRVTPAFQSLAVDTGGGGLWLNLDTGASQRLPEFMASENYTVGYDPATFIVSPETNLQLWDVYGRDRNDRIVFEHPNWNTATYSPDGQHIVTAGVNLNDPFGPGSPIFILEASTGAVVRELSGHSLAVWGLDWSPDGRYIASGAWDDGVIIWDAQTGQEIHRLMGIEDPLIFNIEFTPDSHHILAANRWISPIGGYEIPPYLVMWDVESGELVRRIELDREGINDGIHAIAAEPDNKHALASVGDLRTGQGATYRVDLESGEVISKFDLEGIHYFIAIAEDGQTAFTTAFINGDITEFDTVTGEIIRTWQSPLDQTLNTIAISHDGRYLATGANFDAQEQSVSLWDRESGKLIRRYLFGENAFFLLKLEFSPDDTELLVTGDNGIVRIVPVDEVSALEWIQENRYIRNFTCPERELYRIEPYCESE